VSSPGRPTNAERSASRFHFPRSGTRFLLYPKPRIVQGFGEARLVHVEEPAGSIRPGPVGPRIYVVDARGKTPYRDPETGDYVWRPPYPRTLRRFEAVVPNALGHFDSVVPRTRQFTQAALYASVASVIAIWEHYLGRRLNWGVPGRQRRLELIPRVRRIGDNAWSGDGYIELGFADRDPSQPYAEVFDVVAHEVGHHLLKRVIGRAPADRREFEHKSHEEAGADLVSLVAVLHLDPVVARVLAETRGKLYSVNLLSEIGEYRRGQSGRWPGRLLFHDKTLRSVAVARKRPDKHIYAQPFLGAAFDILVEIYEHHLLARELIPADLARRSTHAAQRNPAIRREFAARYRLNPDGFSEALGEATGDFARLLALTWRKTRRTGATFSKVAANMLAADRRLYRGRYGQAIRRAFRRRMIVPRASAG
jgi:hypothetical protein